MGKEYELWKESFSELGNFGFGIDEHIDLGIKYDPQIGIYGLDFYCVMGRRGGMRVSKRKRTQRRIGFSHRITKEETQKWFIQKFEGCSTPASRSTCPASVARRARRNNNLAPRLVVKLLSFL